MNVSFSSNRNDRGVLNISLIAFNNTRGRKRILALDSQEVEMVGHRCAVGRLGLHGVGNGELERK